MDRNQAMALMDLEDLGTLKSSKKNHPSLGSAEIRDGGAFGA